MQNKEIPFLKLINPDTGESLILSPTLGGTITSLTLGKNLHQIMASDSDAELQDNPLFRGRFLFPFNDRIPMGKYSFQERSYQLPLNCKEDGSSIHGFVYNKELSILEHKESEATLYWHTGNNRISGFPFDLSLTINIKLHKGGTALSCKVKNIGTITSPYALGWHSYFKTDSSSVLKANYQSYFETNESFLPVGGSLPVRGTPFDFRSGADFSEKLIDHTFAAPTDGISLLRNKDYTVKIKQTNFAYTQLFISPDKKSIAIEPISSKPNSFNTNEVLVLQAGEEYSSGITIDII